MCQSCCKGKGKVTSRPAAPVQPIRVTGRRFSHIHIDIMGPLPTLADGHCYLLTMMDRRTRWLEGAPLKGVSATACAESFISTWISSFGVPSLLTSDRGAQFTSAVWDMLCNKLGISHSFTTACHPQSNGVIEPAHRQLKDSLHFRLAGVLWPQHLPLLGLRAAPKEDSGTSSG